MLKTEVYFRKPASDQPGRWWFAILKLGRLRQILDRLVVRRCRDKRDAYKQANAALAHMKTQQPEERNNIDVAN